jgi:hypothetical protein
MPDYHHGVLLISAGTIEGHFEEKCHAVESHLSVEQMYK